MKRTIPPTDSVLPITPSNTLSSDKSTSPSQSSSSVAPQFEVVVLSNQLADRPKQPLDFIIPSLPPAEDDKEKDRAGLFHFVG